jgi:hypothetical protein
MSPVGAGQEAKVHLAFSTAGAGDGDRGNVPRMKDPANPIMALRSDAIDIPERHESDCLLRARLFLTDEAAGINVPEKPENPAVSWRMRSEMNAR